MLKEMEKQTRRGGSSLNCESYGDVITLAVKHLGIRIRPKPDNVFSMQNAFASKGNRTK